MLPESFIKAKRSGTPLIGINTYDPAATILSIGNKICANYTELIPVIQWDVVRGWVGRNQVGIDSVSAIVKMKCDGDGEMLANPVESARMALELPDKSILFMINAHMFFKQDDFVQAIYNLRDPYKTKLSNLVLLGPSLVLPIELKNDILILDEKLPNDEEIKSIFSAVLSAAKMDVKKFSKELSQSNDALRGIPPFSVEQSVALNVDPKANTVDIKGMWDRKIQIVNETPGLRYYTGDDTYKDIGGCEAIKSFMSRILTGKDAPRVIVFIDEGEKMFAGATNAVGDNTGISQDFLGTTLSYMEDTEADGVIFIGPPGTAKSAIAKATGNEGNIPTITLDMGSMKDSLVGASEARIRDAFKVIDAVGGGRAFFVMTCNKIVDLPPELKSRFTSGTFYFDLPTKEERVKIFDIYFKKYKLKDNIGTFDHTDWTGREIRNVCRLSYRQNITLKEASKYVIPVAHSNAHEIRILRDHSNGVYLSANHDGPFVLEYETRAQVADPNALV